MRLRDAALAIDLRTAGRLIQEERAEMHEEIRRQLQAECPCPRCTERRRFAS
jgi:hypothetical protein